MKYRVKSVALNPATWERIGEEREEIIEAGIPGDFYANCVNGRAVGRTYEFFWNELVDAPREVVRVTGVRRVK